MIVVSADRIGDDRDERVVQADTGGAAGVLQRPQRDRPAVEAQVAGPASHQPAVGSAVRPDDLRHRHERLDTAANTDHRSCSHRAGGGGRAVGPATRTRPCRSIDSLVVRLIQVEPIDGVRLEIGERGEHQHHADAVGDGVMDLDDDRSLAIGETRQQPESPQRARTVEGLAHPVLREREGVVHRREAAHGVGGEMVVDIEARNVDPARGRGRPGSTRWCRRGIAVAIRIALSRIRSGAGSASSSQTPMIVDRSCGSRSMCQMIESDGFIIERYFTAVTRTSSARCPVSLSTDR